MSDHFIVVDLPQGTTEWREWRHGGIGASEASVVMGENPFKTSDQLFREKRGLVQDFGQNPAMALGTKLEPEARERYISRTGNQVRPICLQSRQYPWLRASLDGLAQNSEGVVEIKCGRSVYRKASQYRSVPTYYFAQLQHILAITHLDAIDFWCYWPGHPHVLIEVKRQDGYIERLLKQESEFWNAVQSTAPTLQDAA